MTAELFLFISARYTSVNACQVEEQEDCLIYKYLMKILAVEDDEVNIVLHGLNKQRKCDERY